MSVTVTDNAITPSTILQTLGDYEVHHSGGPGSAESRAQPTNPRDDLAEAAQAQNPSNWPTDHRGVPAYKPINRSLDQTQRPGGANPVEQAFIFVLLHGVGHLAVGDPGDDEVGQLLNRAGYKSILAEDRGQNQC